MKTLNIRATRVIWLLLFLLVTGCAQPDQQPFWPVHESFTLPELSVVITTNMEISPCDGRALGCAQFPNRVWMVGRQRDGTIFFDPTTLLHEILHLLDMHYPGRGFNPHKLFLRSDR